MKEPHPWVLPDEDISSGYSAVVSASSLGGGEGGLAAPRATLTVVCELSLTPPLLLPSAIIAVILLTKIILVAQRGDLLNALWPISRDFGVRTHRSAVLALTDPQAAAIVALLVVDMFFRCSAYAQNAVPWAARLSVEWLRTFQPFLVSLTSFRLYLAAFILAGLTLLPIVWRGRGREDAFAAARLKTIAVSPAAGGSSDASEAGVSVSPLAHTPPTRATVFSVLIARAMEGACIRV